MHWRLLGPKLQAPGLLTCSMESLSAPSATYRYSPCALARLPPGLPHPSTGSYQHLRDPAKGPERVARMRKVMQLMSALLEAQHPRHMVMMRDHCKGFE